MGLLWRRTCSSWRVGRLNMTSWNWIALYRCITVTNRDVLIQLPVLVAWWVNCPRYSINLKVWMIFPRAEHYLFFAKVSWGNIKILFPFYVCHQVLTVTQEAFWKLGKRLLSSLNDLMGIPGDCFQFCFHGMYLL